LGRTCIVLFDDDVTRRGAMKSTIAKRDHIERHHPRQHAMPRQSLAQHRDIADAVLQADDDGIGGRMACDEIRHPGGIRAFHGHQHQAGVAKDSRILGQRQCARCDVPRQALEARQLEPVTFDLLDHARARQQRDTAAGGRKHAADKAADAAGPGHADRSVQDHPAFHRYPPGLIAEFGAGLPFRRRRGWRGCAL
jgi:hypothetical protein